MIRGLPFPSWPQPLRDHPANGDAAALRIGLAAAERVLRRLAAEDAPGVEVSVLSVTSASDGSSVVVECELRGTGPDRDIDGDRGNAARNEAARNLTSKLDAQAFGLPQGAASRVCVTPAPRDPSRGGRREAA